MQPRRAPGVALSRRLLALPVVLAVLSLLALVVLAEDHGRFDLEVYQGAVSSWAAGNPLYDYLKPNSPYGFTYPPFAALLMLPLVAMPLWLSYALSLLAGAAIVTATTWWLAARIAPRHGWPTWYVVALAIPLICLLEPVRDTFGYGQVNLLLVALILLDIEGLRRGSRWAGVGTGLAAAIKLTPALFILLLLVARPRAAVNAVAVGALATVTAFIAAPGTSWEFWTRALLDTSRVGKTENAANQALSGPLARLSDSPDAPLALWLPLVVVVGVVGLRRAVLAMRAGDDVAALALVGLTSGLISPLTWVHHLWWLVPAFAVLLDVGIARRSRAVLLSAAAVFLLFVGSWPDHVRQPDGEHLDHGVWVVLGENTLPVVLLLLVVLLPVRSKGGSAPAAVQQQAVSAA